MIPEFHKPTHEWPHRILLRQGDKYYRLIDIQTSVNTANELSVFLKPPSESLYVGQKPVGTLKLQPGTNKIELANIRTGDQTFNPYITWHGGNGRLHTNGYAASDLKKEILLRDTQTVSMNDITMRPDIILTALLPVSTLSHPQTSAPPSGFQGKYLEISQAPAIPNNLTGQGEANIVLDYSSLLPGSLVMDVMVHHRALQPTLQDLPYLPDMYIRYVAQPLTITTANPSVPAVTVFFYQPDEQSPVEIRKNPIILMGRTRGDRDNHIVEVELV